MALIRIIQLITGSGGRPDEGDLQNARREAIVCRCIVRIDWFEQFVGHRHVLINESMSLEDCKKAVESINTEVSV